MLAIGDEEAICLRSMHNSYQGFVFWHNFICMNFLESKMKTQRSRPEQEEQLVLTTHVPPNHSLYCSYSKLGVGVQLYKHLIGVFLYAF